VVEVNTVTAPAKILILEDDKALCGGIARALKSDDREFTLCHTLADAREQLLHCTPHLYILDINLPDGSGLAHCAEIRSAGFPSPILLLTAKDTELDIVTGLESGADDYITKPFSLAVLRARVGALLRRGAGRKQSSPEGFLFDFETMRFEKEGNTVELSKTEARLLQLLTASGGQTVTRETLASRVWPDGAQFVDENALSVAVRRLRAKLEDDPSKPRHIVTVHGIGYKWVNA